MTKITQKGIVNLSVQSVSSVAIEKTRIITFQYKNNLSTLMFYKTQNLQYIWT